MNELITTRVAKFASAIATCLAIALIAETAAAEGAAELSDAEKENLVRRSYQYVALCDTVANWTLNEKSPFYSGGWNKTFSARAVGTSDGKPINARYDHVIRLAEAELPPAIAFWSARLYDAKQGFFIANKEINAASVRMPG